jgi:hypothetical protein
MTETWLPSHLSLSLSLAKNYDARGVTRCVNTVVHFYIYTYTRKHSFRTSQETHYVSITTTNRLMLFRGNNCSLLWESYGTHKYSVWLKYKDLEYWSKWYIYLPLWFKGLILNFSVIPFGIPINKYCHCELLNVTSDASGFAVTLKIPIRPQKRNDCPPLNCLSDNVLRPKSTVGGPHGKVLWCHSTCQHSANATVISLLKRFIPHHSSMRSTHTHPITGETYKAGILSTQIAWCSNNFVYKSFWFVLPGTSRLSKRRNKHALREHTPTSHFNVKVNDDKFTNIPNKLRCSVVLSCRSPATFRRIVLTVFIVTAVRNSNSRKTVHGFKRPQKSAKLFMPGCGTQPDTNPPSCSNKPHWTKFMYLRQEMRP